MHDFSMAMQMTSYYKSPEFGGKPSCLYGVFWAFLLETLNTSLHPGTLACHAEIAENLNVH